MYHRPSVCRFGSTSGPLRAQPAATSAKWAKVIYRRLGRKEGPPTLPRRAMWATDVVTVHRAPCLPSSRRAAAMRSHASWSRAHAPQSRPGSHRPMPAAGLDDARKGESEKYLFTIATTQSLKCHKQRSNVLLPRAPLTLLAQAPVTTTTSAASPASLAPRAAASLTRTAM